MESNKIRNIDIVMLLLIAVYSYFIFTKVVKIEKKIDTLINEQNEYYFETFVYDNEEGMVTNENNR